jgi:hypothetical protein
VQPTFEQYLEGAGALLECPACAGNHLHHGKVEVFERANTLQEDLHVAVGNGTVVEDRNISDNPSSGRNGLSIRFRCEQCSATPLLTISQHKGNTWLNFT